MEQEVNNFSKASNYKDWYNSRCKSCLYKYYINYKKTKQWLIVKIYSSQKGSSKDRWYINPNYTIKELEHWLYNKTSFIELFNKWLKSWYEPRLIPSVDRLDDYKPYSLDNIQLLTWGENKRKWELDRMNGKNNKKNKAVKQIDLKNKVISIYFSLREAERQTWVNSFNISAVCNGKNTTAWWYKWKFII